jgi:hypothetical protein
MLDTPYTLAPCCRAQFFLKKKPQGSSIIFFLKKNQGPLGLLKKNNRAPAPRVPRARGSTVPEFITCIGLKNRRASEFQKLSSCPAAPH